MTNVPIVFENYVNERSGLDIHGPLKLVEIRAGLE